MAENKHCPNPSGRRGFSRSKTSPVLFDLFKYLKLDRRIFRSLSFVRTLAINGGVEGFSATAGLFRVPGVSSELVLQALIVCCGPVPVWSWTWDIQISRVLKTVHTECCRAN